MSDDDKEILGNPPSFSFEGLDGDLLTFPGAHSFTESRVCRQSKPSQLLSFDDFDRVLHVAYAAQYSEKLVFKRLYPAFCVHMKRPGPVAVQLNRGCKGIVQHLLGLEQMELLSNNLSVLQFLRST
ncbi:hypothetical protein DPMN_016214 [Dreissena polymorpha]|uniref:Uncharacterized protein n=1 Tax=Dreissena polymorpha TaxID=45954 RepID=A0A9D4N996_DREPO|nr:hypothetical protein DPMN_016214 [Dreissena polymorpha]